MNSNYPKCENCQRLKCDAGEINHQVAGDGRGACLLCECDKFVASTAGVKMYDVDVEKIAP